MSLSRKNIYAWLILVLAAVLIGGGLSVILDNRLISGIANPEEYSVFATTSNESTAVYSVQAEDFDNAFNGIDDTTVPGSSDSSPTWIIILIRILGFISLLAGCGASAAVLIRLPQEQPLAGPDGSIILFAWSSTTGLYGWSGIIGLSSFIFILLVSSRELAGWIKARCRLSWLACIRLAYLVTQLAFGRDIRHLSTQLEHFQAGIPVEISSGLYTDMETRLQTIQQEHARAIQEAVASEHFKVELITNVSHDLRTPLTAIIGYGELLQYEKLSEKGAESLNQLNRKASYMKDLVENLFELTKVSSGVIAPNMKELDLVSLLEQTIGLMQDELDASKLIVKRKYSSEKMPVVTDGSRMHQVFANLLENACKYALPGSRIYVYMCAYPDKKETAGMYEPADTATAAGADKTAGMGAAAGVHKVAGVGSAAGVHKTAGTAAAAGVDTAVQPSQIRVRIVNTASYEMDFTPEEIMQRFVRGDKARSTQGSGIGLAIAQTYTESVGGSFKLEIDGDQFAAIVSLPGLAQPPL